MAFAPDGTLYAIAAGTVQRWRVADWSEGPKPASGIEAWRYSPDGRHVVFLREDGVFRIGLTDGRAHRLTSGFRKFREPRFLPSGRLLVGWTEDKIFGFDVMDQDGKNRETLSQGTTYYRSVAPSPDGLYLAATFTFDLAFRPQDAFKPRKTEEIHLLDARGRFVAVLERAARFASHSPEWSR
jgi:Tol biopolymer transport system component